MAENADTYAGWPLRPLGHVALVDFVYLVCDSDQVVVLKATEHTEPRLTSLADEALFRMMLGLTGSRGRTDFVEVRNLLQKACRDVGPYQSGQVRGRGAWRDAAINGRTKERCELVVFNRGSSLIIGPQEYPLAGLRGALHFHYIRGDALPTVPLAPVSIQESLAFLDVVKSFGWQHPQAAPQLVLGWIACALVCGALRWRPHIWVTGAKGTGKSTLIHIVNGVLRGIAVNVHSNTTEAGLRQRMQCDALPLIFDEFEANTKSAQDVVVAARAAASDNDAVIIKGTAAGIAQIFSFRFAALFAGINAHVGTDADRSRIVFLELRQRHRTEQDQLALEAASSRFGAEFGASLLRRLLDALSSGKFDKSLTTHREAIRAGGGDERRADLFGHLFAGCHVLVSDQSPSSDEVQKLVNSLSAFDEEEQSDEEACAAHLMAHSLVVNPACPQVTVGEALRKLHAGTGDDGDGRDMRDALARSGVRLDGEHVLIANDTPGIKSAYRNTPWANGGHWRILRRLPGATQPGNRRFASHQSKTTELPCRILFSEED